MVVKLHHLSRRQVVKRHPQAALLKDVAYSDAFLQSFRLLQAQGLELKRIQTLDKSFEVRLALNGQLRNVVFEQEGT